MKRVVFAVVLMGALLGGVMGWTLTLEYEDQVDDVILYEQPMFYPPSAVGLDYTVRNNSEHYIWGFIVALEETYPISYPNPDGPITYVIQGGRGMEGNRASLIQDGEDWWGWKYWGSVVLSPDELLSELSSVYEDAFGNLSDSDIENISAFIEGNILPVFEDYESLYFTYQIPFDTVDGMEIESHPISPGSIASGFGVLRDDNLVPGSPVVFIGTSDGDPDENSSWKFGKTNSVLVPEPMSGCLFLFGLVGGALIRRKR